MEKCKLFSISEKESFKTKGAINDNNKVIDPALLAIANAQFAEDFKKVYGKDVDGLGTDKKGTFVINRKVAEIENEVRAAADERYKGVDPVLGYSDLPGDAVLVLPKEFTQKAAINAIDKKSGGFLLQYSDGNIEEDAKLGDVLKEFPESGFANYANDLLNSQFDLIAGLSIPHRITINNMLDHGKAFEEKVLAEAEKFGSTKEYLDNVVKEDSTLSEDLQSLNEMMDAIFAKTGTQFAVSFERNNDLSVNGMTDTGVIALNLLGIGVNEESLSYIYMHEKAHVLTQNLLKSDPEYRAEMEKLFKIAKEAGVEGYGVTNLLEFVAEAFSNPNFQRDLKRIQVEEVSLWDKIVQKLADAFSKLTGIPIENDLLGRVFAYTYKALDSAPVAPLNGTLSSSLKLLTSIDMNGNYIGEKGDIEELILAAKKVGMTFKPGEGFFYTTKEGVELKIKREDIPLHIMGEYANYNENFENDPDSPEKDLEAELYSSLPVISYSRTIDPQNIFSIENIDGLMEAQLQVTAPDAANNTTGKYIIGSNDYYNADDALGLNPTGAEKSRLDSNRDLVRLVTKTVGKLVFEGNTKIEDITFKMVDSLVRTQVFNDVSKDMAITLEKFNKEYRPPVGEADFDIIKSEFEQTKRDLLKNNVAEFKTNVTVWNNETRTASTIDVLAINKNGSVTVIDIDAHEEGTSEHATRTEGEWSLPEKHALQGNTKTIALENMGFTVTAPKVILSKPTLPTKEPVIMAQFVEIEGDNLTLMLDVEKLSEDKMYDEKGGLVYNIDKRLPGGLRDITLSNKSSAARIKYRMWHKGQMAKEGLAVPGPQLNFEEASSQLMDNIKKAQKILEQYTNFVRKNPSYGALSTELGNILKKLQETSGVDVDKMAVEQAVLLASKFFQHSATQLEQLQTELKNSIGDIEDKKSTYLRIKNYKGMFAIAKELFETIEALDYAMDTSSPAVAEAREQFAKFQGVNSTLDTDLNIALKDLFRSVMAQSYLGSKGEIKMIQALVKEYEAEHGRVNLTNNKERNALYEFLAAEKSKPDFRTRVIDASREEVNKLINTPVNDVSMAAFLFNSDVSINNDYVQLFHNMLLQAEQRFSNIANEKVIELSKIADEVALDKADIHALTVKDRTGLHFLVSDYKIEFYDAYNELMERFKEAQAATSVGTTKEKAAAFKKFNKIKAERVKWLKENTEVDHFTIRPVAKWKTDYSNFTPNQLKALNAFKQIHKDNHTRMGGDALIKYVDSLGAYYYQLPGVPKTMFGYASEGNLVGVAKKGFREATVIEQGDTEEGQVAVNADGKEIKDDSEFRLMSTGLDGKPVFSVPKFFRGELRGDQNLDLFTIYAMELQNGIRYEIDSGLVTDATLFLDMVNASDFVQTAGITKEIIASRYGEPGSRTPATLKGDASVLSKQVEKMMKNRIFAMTQEYGGTVYGKDINRIIATIGSYTTFASMSFKVLGAANNWVTGNIAATLEAIAGEFYTKKDIRAAKALYYNEIGSIIGDVGQPVKKSKINQLMAIFDVQGEMDILNNNFERTNRLTQNLKPGTTLMGYSMGEHEIHATVMLSILHANKILNKNGQFLNKKGEIVATREEAASLIDAYIKGEDGIVRLQDWAEYSEHDTVNKLKGNGEATIRGLIKDRVTRTQGAFDKHMQSELNRRWYGKLIFQFKKHMPPQMLNRFRGVVNFTKSTDELSDDKKYFNLNSKTEEYGYYTTFFRYLKEVMWDTKLNIARGMKAHNDAYEKMSLHERANMTKAITEVSYIVGTYVLAMLAVGAVGDDDDEDLMWGLIYLLRRQTNEGGLAYLNPAENWRVLDSPMAAMSKVNGLIDVLTQIIYIREEYETGIRKGENKFKVRAVRALLLDRLDQFEEGYNKRQYNNLTNAD